VAAYGLEVRNDIIPWDGGAYYTTAGKSRRLGLELGSELKLASGLSGRVGCTLSNNKYLDYHNDLGTFDGNESAGIAPLVLDARARYDWAGGPYAEVGTHSLGRYYADDANAARVPAYGILNLTVGAKHLVGRGMLEGFLAVENVLDGKYVSSVFINGLDGRFYEPGMERNFLAGFSYRAQ
jgi:iron complex outermembrane receptor protein